MLSALCLVAMFGSPAESTLLEKARLVTKVDGWPEGQTTVGMYYWWSPSEVLISGVGKSERLFHISRKTWSSLSADAIRVYMGPGDEMSPDRTKVILQSWKGQTITWRVVDPTGKKEFGSWSLKSHTPRPGRSEMRGFPSPSAEWSTDGKCIYQIEYIPVTKGYDIEITKRELSHVSLGLKLPIAHTNLYGSSAEVFGDRVRLTEWNQEDKSAYVFKEWDIRNPVEHVRKLKVSAPKGKVIIDYYPSPDRKRAVWLMGVSCAKPFADTGYPYQSLSLWSSDIYGENLAEIGSLSFASTDRNDLMDEYQHFGELQWNPDSKNFSFIYNRNLYMVKAIQ